MNIKFWTMKKLFACFPKTSAETAVTNGIRYIHPEASFHMPSVSSPLSQLEVLGPYQIHMGDKWSPEENGRGIMFFFKVGNATKLCTLKNALSALSLQYSLFSVAMIAEKGTISTLTDKRAKLTYNRSVLPTASQSGMLFMVDRVPVILRHHGTACIADLKTCHKRLVQVTSDKIVKTSPENIVIGLSITKNLESTPCSSCCFKKTMRTKISNNSNARNVDLLGIKHSDVCGPIEAAAIENARRFVIFIHQASRWSTVYLMKAKADLFNCFKLFLVHAGRATRSRLKLAQSQDEQNLLAIKFAF